MNNFFLFTKIGATRRRGPTAPSDQQEQSFTDETDGNISFDWKKPDKYQGHLKDWYNQLKNVFETDDGNYQSPKKVDSSNVKSIGYDPSRSRLRVKFLGGGDYQYAGVPEKTYDKLMNAESHGSTFHDLVRPRFSYQRMDKKASIMSEETKQFINEEDSKIEKVGAPPKVVTNALTLNKALSPIKSLFGYDKKKVPAQKSPVSVPTKASPTTIPNMPTNSSLAGSSSGKPLMG